MMTSSEAHQAVLDQLAPITRVRYTYVGDDSRSAVEVNPIGLDLHDGRVGALTQTGDLVDTYMALYPNTPATVSERLTGGASASVWGFRIVIGGSSRESTLWGVDQVQPIFYRTRLHPRAGFVEPYLDQLALLPDESASPARWAVPLIYTTRLQ